ncbi:hypothetical protein B0H13DRAFT_1873982 [Mycena leptocephala]|nr:hypothetical protein B0H13DRAFT_1873982 [Mycena leptocephala]
MDIDNASDDDQPQCDSSSDNENKAPLPISQIDAETDELAHCDMCRTQLGPRAADIDTRAFRCFNCELSVQCETCCSQAHLNFAGHTVQRMQHRVGRAGHDAGVWDDYVHCLQPEAFLSSMLHVGAQTIPLASYPGLGARLDADDSGARGHLGHRGACCLWPVEPAIGMTTVNLKYCGCGNFEPGAAGEWDQIVANGWFRAGLVHPRVCATFQVMSLADEANSIQFGWPGTTLVGLDSSTSIWWLGPPPWLGSISRHHPGDVRMPGRTVESFMGMDGEGIEDSTRTGDRGIFISNDAVNNSLARRIPVLDGAERSEDLRATLDSISADAGTAGFGSRKTYDSLDNPIAEFATVQQDFLDEMLRLAGLADLMDEPKCALCDSKLDAQGTRLSEAASATNTDVILMSLAGFDLKQFTISYDIACRWGNQGDEFGA